MKLIYFICLFFVSCTDRYCFENASLYSRYKEIYDFHSRELDYYADKSTWQWEGKNQQRLFNLLCDKLEKNSKVLYLEIGSIFNNQRSGVIYFFDTKEIVYFKRNNKFKYTIGDGEGKYPALFKILNTLKPNVDKEAKHIEEYIRKGLEVAAVDDAGFCRILYVAKDEVGKPGGYYSFAYLPDRILSDEFEKEFKN